MLSSYKIIKQESSTTVRDAPLREEDTVWTAYIT